MKTLDRYLVTQSLKGFSQEEAAEVYSALCDVHNLDKRLMPFEIIDFGGKPKFYLTKSGCDMLASAKKLQRTIKNFSLDEETFVAEVECEIEDLQTGRKENEISCRWLGRFVPQRGAAPKVEKMGGKEIALEKMKLISAAKRRATLSFIGSSIDVLEDSSILSSPEILKEEVKNIIPPPPVEKEVKQEEVKQEEVKQEEVKQEVKQEPTEEVDYTELAKEHIKKTYKTQKVFTEKTGKKVEDLINFLAAGKTFPEFLQQLHNEKKATEEGELFEPNKKEHKKLLSEAISEILQSSDWKKDSEFIEKNVLPLLDKLTQAGTKIENLQEDIKNFLGGE